jgi:prevent-host-death family protein
MMSSHGDYDVIDPRQRRARCSIAMKVSVWEAKARLSELVGAAQSGGRVVVTKYGRSVAEIKSIASQDGIDFKKLDELRRESGIVDSDQDWPDEFDDPDFSREALGL